MTQVADNELSAFFDVAAKKLSHLLKEREVMAFNPDQLENILQRLLAVEEALSSEVEALQKKLAINSDLLNQTLITIRQDIAANQDVSTSIENATTALNTGIDVLRSDQLTHQQEGVKLNELGAQLVKLADILKGIKLPENTPRELEIVVGPITNK